jgi:KDO2-lipid IV(A) lauroyltransferase
LGFIAGSILRIRRRHVEAAMVRAGIDSREAPAMYTSLGTAIFEFLWMAGRRRAELANRVQFTPRARRIFADARAAGRGMVIATAHTGNWDLAACAAARDLLSLTVVTKRLHAGWLDRFWQRERAEQGIELIDGNDVWARAGASLRRGRAVAMVIDQAPERTANVLEAPFLGAPARCDRTPALLALRARVPLALVLGRRLPDGTHEVDVPWFVEPPVRSSRAWANATTLSLQAELDAFVRQHPSQWLWLHRRWKAAPHAKMRRPSTDVAPRPALSVAIGEAKP